MKLWKYAVIFTMISLNVFGMSCSNTSAQKKKPQLQQDETAGFLKKWEGKIYPTTIIGGTDVSGKTREEAIELLNANSDTISHKVIDVKYGEKIYTITGSELNAKYNIEESVDNALNASKVIGNVDKKALIENAEIKSIDLALSYNDEAVENLLNTMEKDINKAAANAQLKFDEKGKAIISNYVRGEKLNRNATKDLITKQIVDRNATKAELTPVVDVTEPSVTEQQLKAIDSVIATASTSYRSSQQGRASNIQLAAGQINGVLLMPGEVFSFNIRTGKRNEARGYQIAPIIIKNNLEDGIGGGVCQVSSTLYNAILKAGIKPIERRNHSLAPAYIKPGLDATVSDKIDFKFANTLKYPIYIQGITKGGIVTFNIYSNSSLNTTKYKIQCEITEKSKASIKTIQDNTLNAGVSIKDEPKHNGYKVDVYLVATQNGKEVSREIISKDVYKKVDGIIRVGTKK